MSQSNPLTPHLELMVEKEASDLFLTANAPVKIKIDGKIISVGKTILTPEIGIIPFLYFSNSSKKYTFSSDDKLFLK